MKRIFSLILAFVAVQMMSLAAVHTYKVTSPNASGEGSLYDIVSQINELPQKDEAVVTFNLPSSAQNTIDADTVTFIIKRVISIQGGTNKVTIKSSGFYFSDTLVKEISNINFTAESGSQGLRFDYPMNLLSGCSFSGYSISILAPLSTGSIDIIQNCSFSNANNAGIYSYGNIGAIKGCTFANCSKGIAVYDGTKFQPTVDVINDCKFNGCETPLMVHAESVSEISKVVADGGTSSIYSNVETFSNCDFSGSVSFYNLASNSKIDNCHFKSNLSFYSSDLGEMSRVVADTAIQLSSANIFVLRNSKLKCGISGSSKMDGTTRFVKDTITNPKGHGIYLHNDLISIDSCIISDCGENGIYYTKISELKNSQIYNCAEDGVRVYSESVGLISNCKIHDCGVGVMVNSVLTTIESCEIYDNTSAGIHVYQGSIKKISNCSNISGSPKGIHCAGTVSEISNCSITDNEYGIYQEYGTIGVIKKCNILDNGDGGINCPTTVSLDSISHCVISGSKVGILYGRVGGNNGGGSVIEGCVIGKDGTNKLLDGNDIGVQIGNMSAATLVDNVISGNTSYGIYIDGKPHMDVKDNYIGTNSSLQNLGNGVGVYSDMYGANEFSNNVIAYNIIGLKEMGAPSLLYDNTFIGNSEAGVYVSTSERSAQESRFNTTKFLNSPAGSKAVDVSSLDDARQLGTPVITGVTAPDKDGYVYVSGTVDDMNGYDKVSVSLFASDGRSQDAVEFLASDSTDVSGAFKIKVKKGEAPFFSVIAIAERYSYAYSEFSEVYNAFFTTSFFVKTERNGTGDGSSWTNAMSGEDFARILPLVADGTKFYIAEGKYQPIYDNKGEVPTDITDKEFFTTKCVSIYGGFPSTAKGTDLTSDPAKYLTVFDGDLAQNNPQEYDYDEFSYGSFRNDDVRHILRIQPVNSGSVEISGIVFENSRQNSREGSACLDVTGSSSNKVSCDINKCTFSRGTTGLGLYSCSDSKVSECLFLNNETGGSFSDAAKKSTVRVEKNTFQNIQSWHLSSLCKKAIIVNNTFAKTSNLSNSIAVDTAYVMNNTISGEVWVSSSKLVNLVGNIINGDVAYSYSKISSSHNVYLDVNKDSTFVDGSDVLATDAEIAALLSKQIVYDGGFTPVIPLQDDKLTSGASIRFPLSETMVTEDQRGVARLSSTCAGAYEIACSSDTIYMNDTITVNEEFLGKTYSYGRYEGVVENRTGDGCDSVISHTIFVKPPHRYYLYVKVKAEGTGDGSSWENAMSAEDFASCLPLVDYGASFYVAEGTYRPKYGKGLSTVTSSKELCFEFAGNVSIRGGYPADAESGAVSEPQKYKTIFDGDFNGDDLLSETLGEDGQVILSMANTEDNSESLFYDEKPGYHGVNISGIIVKNSNNGIFINTQGAGYSIATCEFSNNKNAINLPYYETLKFEKVSFVNNYSRCFLMNGGGVMSMDSVSFENNYGLLLYSVPNNGSGYNFDMRSISVKNNVGEDAAGNHPLIYAQNATLKLVNSEFKQNYGLMKLSGSVQIDSSSFEGNKGSIVDESTQYFSIDYCSFKENTYEGNLVNCVQSSSSYCSIVNSEFVGNEVGGVIYALADSINVHRSQFSGNTYSETFINFDEYKNSADMLACNIHDNVIASGSEGYPILIRFNGTSSGKLSRVGNNSIWNNSSLSLFYITSSASEFMAYNNTVVTNECSLLFDLVGNNAYLNNNTIVGNNVDGDVVRQTAGVNNEFYGNIILGNSKNDIIDFEFASVNGIIFSHNIVPLVQQDPHHSNNYAECVPIKNNFSEGNTNIVSIYDSENLVCEILKSYPNRNEEILTALFEGTYDAKTNLFTPVLQDKDGYLPTLALKSDVLADGTSIRFPLSETTVTEDQRGVARLDSTCMGAYEINCANANTNQNDTITVGEEFLGEIYSVGRHDSIIETFAAVDGCEKMIIHTLFVKPDPSVLAYYVKTKSEGKGDGSSWENAMSGDDFAACLPLAPDGATFYVAQGNYKPKYGANLSSPNSTNLLCYEINSKVNILGGYPSNAKTGALSDPKKYETIFDGDILGNDKYSDTLNAKGVSLPVLSNMEDNSDSLFVLKGNCSFSANGVSFIHSNCALSSNNEQDTVGISLTNSLFYRNRTTVSSRSNGQSSFVMRNCDIYDCDAVDQNMFYVYHSDLTLNLVNVHNCTANVLFSANNLSDVYHDAIDSLNIYDNSSNYILTMTNGSRNGCRFVRVNVVNNIAEKVLFNYGEIAGAKVDTSLFKDNICGEFISLDSWTDFNYVNIVHNIMKSASYLSSVRGRRMNYCLIEDNEYPDYFFSGYGAQMSHCIIRSNKGTSSFCYGEAHYIDNSLIESNEIVGEKVSGSDNYFFKASGFNVASSAKMKFFNNTFANNKGYDGIIYAYDPLRYYIYNNTFVNNVIDSFVVKVRENRLTEIKGNIIVGNYDTQKNYRDFISFETEPDAQSFGYNIMSLYFDREKGCFNIPAGSNIVYKLTDEIENVCAEMDESLMTESKEDIFSVLDGTYSSATGLFTPAIEDNRGFSPTIALLQDTLPDGTSIRFPLSETMVTEDQRGVARLDSTCMGAYEINCGPDTLKVNDTIVVGGEFLGVTYDAIGRYDSIFETKTSPDGCVSTMMYTLYVKPDPSVLAYYVKTKSEGKGDGSSWENAMSGDDFAACLPMAPDGATFYVAEGRYTPKYTKGLSIPQKPSEAYYEINSSVTIRGGYPSDAKTDAVSEPDKYITEFSGDNSNMFLSFAKSKDIVWDGLTIQNTAQAILMTTTINSIEINNSVFYNCSNSALTVPYEMSRLKIYNSKFLKNGMVLYIPYITSAEIDKCTFEENTNLLISAGSNSPDGYLKISNSDFTKNKGVKQINANIQSYFTNCHFSSEENPIINSSQYPTNIINSSFEKFNSYCLIGSAVIDSCLFKQNHVILFVDGEITMSNSYLLQNDAIPIIQTDKLCINSCTFTENYYPNGSTAPFMSIDSLKIFNSTFLNNHRDSAMFYVVEYFDIENNTILGSGGLIYYHQYDKGKCKGNIILLDRSQQYTYSFPSSVLENNIVGTTGKEEYLSVSDMKSILDTKEDGTFNLKDNGGFTPTIALKSDTLPDGTSIRFPLSETTVTEDQIGVARLDSTCMGAVEFVCPGDAFETKDTINLGDSYTFQGEEVGKAITRAGVYHYSDTLKTSNGCDSIINLTLAVRPELLENGYFVKVKGTGNGEDWENAMSAAMFDTLLPLFPDGAKVFIAEGTYKSDSYAFEVNSSISLTGGFPADAVTGAVSDPENYTTTLYAGGKYNDDDMSEYTYSFYNFDDNKSCVLNIRGDRDVEMYGLTIKGAYSCDSGAVNMENASLTIDRCVFKMNVATAIKAGKGADLNITNSYFTLNFGPKGGVFNLDGSTLNVSKSLFSNNMARRSDCGIDSIGGVAYMNNTKASIENSTFTGNVASKGSVFALDNSDFTLTNTTIVGNGYEGTNNEASVLYTDENSTIELFANMILGNRTGYYSSIPSANINTDYNIVDEGPSWLDGANDRMMERDEIVNVLDVDVYEDRVRVNLKEIGGYTMTLPVISSDFSRGKVICIKPEDKRVSEDQRGMVRKDTSCVGAFEFPTYMNYYVKTTPHGDGSGRDWANAMGDTTFAKYFSVVPTGATFHVAEGLYHAYTVSEYRATRPLNVIGSYPADAQEGSVADASRYTTTLSSDMNDDDKYVPSQYEYSMFDIQNLKDNESRLININSKVDGQVKLYGLRFIGNYPMFRGSSAALELSAKEGKTLTAEIDSCSFVYDYAAIYSSLDSLTVRSCRFDTLYYTGLSHSKHEKKTYLKIDASSFTNTINALTLGEYYSDVEITNSTFSNIWQFMNCYTSEFYGVPTPTTNCKFIMNNNTLFVDNSSYYTPKMPGYTDFVFNGNIISSQFMFDENSNSIRSTIVSDYNLFVGNTDTVGNAFPYGENDLVVEPKEVEGVIAGTLKDDLFYASSKKMNKEDLTLVVELLEDKLADDRYIRWPIEKSSVKIDQLGQYRRSMTSMGAYEIECKPDTFVIYDTIQVGGTFLGELYENVGNYEIFGSDSLNEIGCPLKVAFRLYVTPSFEGTGYYVMTERVGRGTGTDWANAMNGADMAYGITQVPDDAVFHVAQGDYNLTQLAGSDTITVPHSFSIVGGYGKSPKKGDVPNVDNKTTLSADKVGFVFQVEGQGDDATASTTVGFYNLYMDNVTMSGAQGRDVVLDSCSVSATAAFTLSNAANVKINDVWFNGQSGAELAINADSTASVTIENTSFSGYGTALSASFIKGDMTIANTTFSGNESSRLIDVIHEDGTTKFYNNTVVGNGSSETTLALDKAIVKGNIFLGNVASKLDVAATSEIAYNVFSEGADYATDKDVLLKESELALFLDGTYDATTGAFAANMKNNRGFTPTIALMKDSFPDNTLARFSKENTIVDYDQRGIPRLELLCYGAYELYDGVRDTVVIPVLDSICLGSDYSFGALSLETSDMKEGETTSYDYFVKGVLTSDTLYQLSLVVVPVLNIQLDDVMASPTLCHGSGNGAVKFSSYVKRSGSMDVIINNAAGKTVSSEMTRLISDYQKNDLPLGKYTASLVSNASCVVDTSFSFEVTDRDSMQAEDCADTLYTTCANEPTSQLTIPIRGFHSSATFYIDDTEINALSANAVVEYDDDADFTAQASIKLSAIDLGSHNVTAIDACGKKYDLKKFEVLMSKAYEIAMDEVDYRKDSLKCGLDLAYAKFHILSGTSATFSLTSDKGYNYTNVFSGKDTTLSFDDLGRGDYRAVLIKNLAGCSDSIVETFSIKSQEPLLQSLTVNGVLCADANIKVDAQGGRGAYTYHWTYPDGTKHDLSVGVLSDVNAGDYICVVEDGDGCFSDPDTASLKSEQELSALVVDTVYFKDITCITSNNGTIVAKFSSNDNKQSVTCSVTNLETNEISKATATKQKGELKINTLPAGKYSYDIYYGSAECRMDTNGVKGTFEIHSKSNIFKMDELKVTSPQTCLSSPNAIAEIDASGWEDDYMCYFINPTKKDSSYRVMKGEAVNGDIHFITPGLNGGSYIFRVYDACGSSVTSNGIDLPTYDKYEVTEIDHTDSLLCAKEKSGEIIFSVKGGIPSVAVPTINDKKLSITDEIKVSDLGQGTYRIAYGPSNVQSCPKDLAYLDVRIAGPDSLKIEYLLSGNCPTSKLSATVTGESAPYTYVWNYGDLHEETEKPILPFEIQRGETYSLSVTDAHQCDTYTEEVRIPDASELPGLKISLTPEAQKCHNEDNGSLVIKPSLTKATNLSLVSTVSYVLEGTTDTISVENTLRSNGDNDFVELYNVLKPGVYYATVRLGGLDCDMGVAPATGKARVDSIGELQFSTEFNTTPMTCTSSNPNGTATFDVAGWVWSNTLEYYEDGVEKVGGLSDVKPEKKPNYVGGFQLNDLRGTTYVVHVEDICHNEIFGKFTVDQFEPKVEIDSVTHLTCYNNANGSFLCKIYGWTPKHKATLVCQGSNYFKTSDPTRFSVDTINGQPVATFRAQGMHTGKWNLSVVNECGETLTDTATVNGFDYYNIELDKSSIIDLKCPYDTNGVIVLNVTGGIGETELISASATKVNYPCLVPSDDTTITYEEKRTYQVVASYDSAAVADTLFDTIISGHDVWIDTILTYPRRVDTTGEFMFDTIWSITQVPVIHTGYKTATCDSLSHVPYRHSSFVPSTQWTNTSGVYTYVNGKEGSYHFIYRSTAPGCHDSTDILVRITRPVNVEINNAVLPISCTTSTDGEITILPFRGPDFKSMMIGDTVFVGHDTLNTFKMNKLYTYDRDENGNRVVVTYPKGKNPDSIRIDELYIDDIETVSWSREKSDKSWEVIDNNIVFPDSSDLLETAYYKDGYVVTTPVYANTPLEPFWFDHMGDYFYRNTITVSNLAPGRYSVKLTDHNACVYTDTFKVEEPERPLKIDSVVYDPAAAYCDPSKRQILAYGSGGWGSYNFTFSDTAKVTTLGEQSDGYRGGEATYYSSETMTGWGVSQYLDPGLYTVVLLDEKGCMVQSEEQYSVKSKFKLHIDTTKTHCPEDPTAPVIVKFIDKPKDGTKFDVYEITDHCRTDTLDDCRDSIMVPLLTGADFKVKNDTALLEGIELSARKLLKKTHGLFVYEATDEHCGTYVQGTIDDSIPSAKASKKDITPVTCNGAADGSVEFFVNGGSTPYYLERNDEWNSSTVIETFHTTLNSYEETVSVGDPSDTTTMHDTTVVRQFFKVNNMKAGSYAFTLLDSRGCRSVLGSPETFDTLLVVKEPDPLTAVFNSSVVCPEASLTKGGNIFFQNVSGGTKPYIYSYSYRDVAGDDCDAVTAIETGELGYDIHMYVTDQHECKIDTVIQFKNDNLIVDSVSFWASTWRNQGDILALIDVCGPDENLDSVSYVFKDKDGKPDPRVELLDKRMYIYDIANGEAKYRNALTGIDTKTEASDAYFRNHFNLLIDEELAKHISFIRLNDTTQSWKNSKSENPWAEHTVLMKAYFKGCEYQYECKEGLKVAYDGYDPYEGGVSLRSEIVSMEVSPNPFETDFTVTARFSSRVDADLYFYNMNGNVTAHPIKVSASELVPNGDEFVATMKFTPAEIFGDGGVPATDAIIVFLKTKRDAISTIALFHDADMDK